MSSPAAIADSRAHLQARVTLFTRAIFFLFTGLSALVFSLMTQTMGAEALAPWRLATFFLPPLILGSAWLFLRRGPLPEATLRGVEITATLFMALFFGSVCVFDPTPESSTVGIFHVTVYTGVLLTLRAAVVPSPALTTLLVSAIGLVPLHVACFVLGRKGFGFLFQGTDWSRGTMNFVVLVVPAVGLVIVPAIVSRVVHGLETKVRAAMRLGQYTLEEKLGEGGMGQVYKARHAMLRRPTAIKLLPADRVGDQAIERFEREVQNTSRLTHPNTVAIYDYGRTPEGVFYYAMEYLDGLALDQVVAIDGPQPPARVVHLLVQAAEALAEAHGLGLIHRDIKPANIVLCERGGVPDTVKVLDFGLVKDVAAPAEVALTATTTITGTPLYLAPEALADPSSVDARTDLYALGAVGYFLLCGAPVFEGKTVVEVCSHHLHTVPEPPSKRLGLPVPAALEAILLRCLEKKPADRPASATELRDALLACRVDPWSSSDARRWWHDHEKAIAAQRHAEPLTPASVTVAARM